VGSLVLIPWHLGDHLDVTLGAVRELKRIGRFLAEDPAQLRRELATYHVDELTKEIVEIGFDPDAALLDRCRAWLATGDVGLVSSSGVPCFADPGAWLVAVLRGHGVEIRALAGASALSTVLSLSGIEWMRDARAFTFHFFLAAEPKRLTDLLARKEPIVVFLAPADLAACLACVSRVTPHRQVSAFYDVARGDDRRADPVDRATAATLRPRAAENVTLVIHDR
jgi:16S rRNA (cytidine1402-2'-O)-methyltransferase